MRLPKRIHQRRFRRMNANYFTLILYYFTLCVDTIFLFSFFTSVLLPYTMAAACTSHHSQFDVESTWAKSHLNNWVSNCFLWALNSFELKAFFFVANCKSARVYEMQMQMFLFIWILIDSWWLKQRTATLRNGNRLQCIQWLHFNGYNAFPVNLTLLWTKFR